MKKNLKDLSSVITKIVQDTKIQQDLSIIQYFEQENITLDDLLAAPSVMINNLLEQKMLELDQDFKNHLLFYLVSKQCQDFNVNIDQTREKKKVKNIPLLSVPDKKKSKSRKVEDYYETIQLVGSGAFSQVWKGRNLQNGDIVAIKIIARNNLSSDGFNKREIEIMRRLKHANIIQLIDVFEQGNLLYLIMELAEGGELFLQISERGFYSEQDAVNLVRQILEAVAYLHRNGICHRDLKPENLLLGGPDNSIIKVSDFGLSKDFHLAVLETTCGSPDYVAPDVLLNRPYSNAVDIWSIGVITYILVSGTRPFYGNSEQEIYERILTANYKFFDSEWSCISKEAKNFVSSILVVDPEKRPTAEQLLQHPWIKNRASTHKLPTFDSFKKGIISHNQQRKTQKKGSM